MDINEIIPYARNARHNKKAIPAVADSIRQFGLRGQIVLESRENPVIVTGHTRVEACKSLGWKEIPDENIAYCDGLTEDEIKAYRIADNKTGEISTWNISMLKSEVKSIGKLDMTKFGCDFKSKDLMYGAERLKTDKGYNLDIVNRYDCGISGMPELPAIDCKPDDFMGFILGGDDYKRSLYKVEPTAAEKKEIKLREQAGERIKQIGFEYRNKGSETRHEIEKLEEKRKQVYASTAAGIRAQAAERQARRQDAFESLVKERTRLQAEALQWQNSRQFNRERRERRRKVYIELGGRNTRRGQEARKIADKLGEGYRDIVNNRIKELNKVLSGGVNSPLLDEYLS